MVALNMRGGRAFDEAFAVTRSEAEWLKSVADAALADHPRKTAQPTKIRSTPPRRRSRTPLSRRRGVKGRGKGGKDKPKKEDSRSVHIGPGHKGWEERKKLACRTYNKGKCDDKCPNRV